MGGDYAEKSGARKKKRPGLHRDAGESWVEGKLFQGLGVGHVLGGFLVEEVDQGAARSGNADAALADDFEGGEAAAVDFGVGHIVLAKGGAFEGDAGEEAAGAGIAEDFRAHGDVAGGGGVAALGAGGSGGVNAEFDFAFHHGFGALGIHDQEDEIGGLAAELEADAQAFEAHHGGRAPGAGVMLAAAADHGAFAGIAADAHGEFDDGGDDDDALGLIEQVDGDVIGNVENFLEDRAAVFKAFGFLLAFFGGERKRRQGESQEQRRHLFDQFSPRRILGMIIIRNFRSGAQCWAMDWMWAGGGGLFGGSKRKKELNAETQKL